LQVGGGEEAAVLCTWWKVLADDEGPGEKKERGGAAACEGDIRWKSSVPLPLGSLPETCSSPLLIL